MSYPDCSIRIVAYARDVLSFDLPVRPIRQAHGPEALEGWAHHPEEDRGEAHSKSGPDPSTMLRVMVRYSNHEALEGEAPRGVSPGRRLDRWYGEDTDSYLCTPRFTNHSLDQFPMLFHE